MLKFIFQKILKGEKLTDAELAFLFDWADKAAVLAAPQNVTLVEQNITPLESTVYRVVDEYIKSKANINNLAAVSNQLGLQIAGEFRTGNGVVPGDGFTGGRFGYPGFTYNGILFFLAGVDNDTLKIGLSLVDGTLYAVDADISGTITATSGNIGGWHITDFGIYKWAHDAVGIFLDSSTPLIQVGDTDPTKIHIQLNGSTGTVQSSNFVSGQKGFQISAPTGNAEFNNLVARGELKTFLLTSQNQMAVAGSIIVSKDAGKLGAELLSGSTSANFGKSLVVGDWVKFQGPDADGNSALEWMLIGSLVSGTIYNVTRNVDGSGANHWLNNTPFVVIGKNGDSRIELVAGATGTIQLITQGAAWNTSTVQAEMSTVLGAITAGAGAVVLNKDGITVSAPTAVSTVNAYKFSTGAAEDAGLYSAKSTDLLTKLISDTTNLSLPSGLKARLFLVSSSDGTKDADIIISASGVNNNDAAIIALTSSNAGQSSIVLNNDGSNVDTVIKGDTTDIVTVDAGLEGVGIGGAAESGYKLKVTGKVNLTTGNTYDINGAPHQHVQTMIFPAHGLNGTIPAGATYRTPVFYYGLQVSSDFSFTVDRAGTLKLFSAWNNSTQPATGSLVGTVYKNSSPTALTVTFVNADGTAYKQDTTHTVAVVAGDFLAIRWLNNASAASAQVNGVTLALEMATT